MFHIPAREQVITPDPPDETVGNVLAVDHARILSLDSGNPFTGGCGQRHYLLVAVDRGSLTFTALNCYRLLEEGQALVSSNLSTYTLNAITSCICMLMELGGELPNRLLGDRLTDGLGLFPSGAPSIREALYTLAVLNEEHTPVSGDTASSYAYSMLVKLRSAHVSRQYDFPALVEAALAIIQREFPYLAGLDELACRLQVSKSHLARSFSLKTGISPGKYIVRVRIEHAKLLLQEPDVTVTYVAMASGFSNANYFSKVFRRETGMSPTEYVQSYPSRNVPHTRRPFIL